jgi:hypothetical protein
MNYTKYENEIEQGLKEVYGGNFKAKINQQYNSLMIHFDNKDLKENTKFSIISSTQIPLTISSCNFFILALIFCVLQASKTCSSLSEYI